MKFRLDHPVHTAVHAEYGHDPHLGFFVEVHARGRRLDYDALHGDYVGLAGALAFLAKGGFFTLEDLYEALLHGEREPEEHLRTGLRPIAQVVTNFKVASDPA